jgi:hypothetical protein
MTFDWHWPASFTRVTAGLLFAMAAVYKVFIMTRQVHARKLFLVGPEFWHDDLARAGK